MHRLESVARVRDGASEDNAERVLEERVGHFGLQLDLGRAWAAARHHGRRQQVGLLCLLRLRDVGFSFGSRSKGELLFLEYVSVTVTVSVDLIEIRSPEPPSTLLAWYSAWRPPRLTEVGNVNSCCWVTPIPRPGWEDERRRETMHVTKKQA
jgi:hypothetical protein